MIRRAVWVAGIVSMSACSTSGPVRGPAASPPPTSNSPSRSAPAESVAVDPRSRTLDVMLERARTERTAGLLLEAEATLEAALRIAPGDARLWLELAEVQFAAGAFAEAATLAERALSLAGGNTQVRESALRIRALSERL